MTLKMPRAPVFLALRGKWVCPFREMLVICPLSSVDSLLGQRSQREALRKLRGERRSARFLIWGPDAALGSSS